MKDSEFIELLNLYLDHEISPADAARLEAEIQGNAKRRDVYRDYCRMQKACKVIAAEFVTEGESVPAADRKVVAFDPTAALASGAQRRNVRMLALGGLAAAAACVALVFVNRGPQSDELSNSAMPAVAQSEVLVAPSVAGADARSVAPRGFAPSPQRQNAVLISNPLLLTEHTQARAIAAAAARQADNQLAWLEAVTLAPLPERRTEKTELSFDARFVAESRTLGSPSSGPAKQAEAEEEVAFKYLK